MENEFQSLADELYRERVLRARKLPVELRLIAGAELFDFGCEASLAGLRAQMPQATESELFLQLRRRLNLSRRLEAKQA